LYGWGNFIDALTTFALFFICIIVSPIDRHRHILSIISHVTIFRGSLQFHPHAWRPLMLLVRPTHLAKAYIHTKSATWIASHESTRSHGGSGLIRSCDSAMPWRLWAGPPQHMDTARTPGGVPAALFPGRRVNGPQVNCFSGAGSLALIQPGELTAKTVIYEPLTHLTTRRLGQCTLRLRLRYFR